MFFVLIFSIYLFIYSKRCKEQQVESTTCFYLLMEMVCWLHVVMVLIFSIYLFIYWNRCQQHQRKSTPLLFIYANFLLITCRVSFNIEYLFVYLFKAMSRKAAQVNTFVYLLIQMVCWLHVLFILIFSIYLFIYSKRCQQKQHKSPPVFIYLWKWLVDKMCFSF